MNRLTSILVALALLGTAMAAPAPVTLDDLYAEADLRDVAIAPGGRYLALIVRQDTRDVVVVHDLDTGKQTVPTSVDHHRAGEYLETRMSNVYWKSDERLLFRVVTQPGESAEQEHVEDKIGALGSRVFAINRDGSKSVRLLSGKEQFLLNGALNQGEISHLLPRDPDHVMMQAFGFFGPGVFRVDVNTGAAKAIELPSQHLVGWWIDVDGNPVVRVDSAYGTVRFSRKQPDGNWKEFYRVPVEQMRERPEYEPVGASNEPGRYYVLARPPGHDRRGIYLYDLTNEKFGDPLVEHPKYDVESAGVSADGTRLLYHCYVADVRICELANPATEAHMKGLRKYFQDTASIYVADQSTDGSTLVLFVEGPSSPPAFYYYRLADKKVETIGPQRNRLTDKTLPRATAVRWKARDGLELSGYLTRPHGAESARSLPLVVMPHGGPERRDRMMFDPWVQFLASRGYAVFQPNFRGSDGFGRSFAESGYGQWGRAMQNDITDGLQALVDQSIADPSRVCIVGASYGGYAALAGATLTPERYKCAVSMAGVSDLSALVKWYKFENGPDSPVAAYWMRAIGNPDRDLPRMRAVSPVHLAKAVTADVLLIHGERDGVVPIAQSKSMKKALEKSGRKITLLELEHEGHSDWSNSDQIRVLNAIDAFLQKNIGPGYRTGTQEDIAHAQEKP